MADDRGLEGPADAGHVEAPTGLTPLEMRAGEEARRLTVEHIGVRPNLTMDQLVELTDRRVRLEKEIRLPGDARGGKNRVYMFSIDGTLRGAHVRGCIFAGSCIMVQSDIGFEPALKMAREGLETTISLAKEYYEQLNRSVVVAKGPLDEAHLNVDVGGRRSGSLASPNLATDLKLRAMLEHLIGGKPWKA